jgi:hypothetical protein
MTPNEILDILLTGGERYDEPRYGYSIGFRDKEVGVWHEIGFCTAEAPAAYRKEFARGLWTKLIRESFYG